MIHHGNQRNDYKKRRLNEYNFDLLKQQFDYKRNNTSKQLISFERSGKWTREEENYADRLISDFEAGILSDCEDGCTLRSYLAKSLNCAPMRISKKYSGQRIGKLVFSKKQPMDSKEITKPSVSLHDLKYMFLKSYQNTSPFENNSVKSSEFDDISSLTGSLGKASSIQSSRSGSSFSSNCSRTYKFNNKIQEYNDHNQCIDSELIKSNHSVSNCPFDNYYSVSSNESTSIGINIEDAELDIMKLDNHNLQENHSEEADEWFNVLSHLFETSNQKNQIIVSSFQNDLFQD